MKNKASYSFFVVFDKMSLDERNKTRAVVFITASNLQMKFNQHSYGLYSQSTAQFLFSSSKKQ